ncbi:MAG: tyrosine recombinase XerC [Bacteroidales bacterium]|nr:tyrosine recombinase XerC [Bacteroidales bacterium]
MVYSNRFIEYIKYEKRSSINTVQAYKSDLQQFYYFLKRQYNIDNIKEVNHLIIRSWIIDLIDNGISNRSINRKLSTLKSFYKYLLRNEIIDKNPMNKILSPKTTKKLPVFVEEEKMNLLLDEVDFGEGFTALRDKLIVEMLYDTGIRLSELTNLKVSDVKINDSSLKVLGKRNKERIIPFCDRLRLIINEYLKQRKEVNTENCEYFFITAKGKKVYPKLIYRIVNNYLSKVTTLQRKSPHVLRHTFATHMLNHGADLNAIKELLGHANLSATQIYTHNTIENLKNIYKQAHPKA